MKFNIGDYVRISGDYPHDRILQGKTGAIVGLPTESDEYVVELDGGITKSVFLEGKRVKVVGGWLEPEKRMKRGW